MTADMMVESTAASWAAINNASISTQDLLARITKHYTDELLRQVYKVRPQTRVLCFA